MTTLSKESYDYLESDFSQFGEWRTYSGRGMYGKYCLGFECDSLNDLITTVVQLSKCYDKYPELDPFIDRISRVSSDSMGLGVIFYWRNITVDTDD